MDVDFARNLAADVEARSLAAAPAVPPKPDAVLSEIRKCLIRAADVEVLATPPHRVFQLLNLDVKRRRDGSTVAAITGGCAFDKGQPSDDFFYRTDQARISFSSTIAYGSGAPELAAYRFHLQFPAGTVPAFVRFDLNPGLGNDPLLEPRSHVHLGWEEARVAVPLMAPIEVLEKLLYGIPVPRGTARAR